MTGGKRRGEDWGIETQLEVTTKGWLLRFCRQRVYNQSCTIQHLFWPDSAVLCFMHSPCLPNTILYSLVPGLGHLFPYKWNISRPNHVALHLGAITYSVLEKHLLPQHPTSLPNPIPPPSLSSTKLFLFYPIPSPLPPPIPPPYLPSSISDPSFHSCPHRMFILLPDDYVPLNLAWQHFLQEVFQDLDRDNKILSLGEFWHYWTASSKRQRLLPTLFSSVSLASSPVPDAKWKLNRYAKWLSASMVACHDSVLALYILNCNIGLMRLSVYPIKLK